MRTRVDKIIYATNGTDSSLAAIVNRSGLAQLIEKERAVGFEKQQSAEEYAKLCAGKQSTTYEKLRLARDEAAQAIREAREQKYATLYETKIKYDLKILTERKERMVLEKRMQQEAADNSSKIVNLNKRLLDFGRARQATEDAERTTRWEFEQLRLAISIEGAYRSALVKRKERANERLKERIQQLEVQKAERYERARR